MAIKCTVTVIPDFVPEAKTIYNDKFVPVRF